MSTNRLKNQFIWEEEIPEIGQKGDLFRDRIFVVSVKRGKIIKLSASFAYDLPDIRFEMKFVEGKELLNEVIDLEFRYTLGTITGFRKKSFHGFEIENSEFEGVNLRSIHPNFDSVFCNGNHGKKVTFSLSTIFDVLKIDEEPPMEKCLKLPEMLYMKKELSDIKLICGGEIFECHKLILSCQSDVFETMFKTKSRSYKLKRGWTKSSKFLTYFILNSRLWISKGQIKPKADWRAVDSPKKRTNEFVLFAF